MYSIYLQRQFKAVTDPTILSGSWFLKDCCCCHHPPSQWDYNCIPAYTSGRLFNFLHVGYGHCKSLKHTLVWLDYRQTPGSYNTHDVTIC